MRTHRWAWALGAAILASCGTYGAPDSVVFGQAVITQPAPGFVFAGRRLAYYLDPNYNEVGDNPLAPTVKPVPATVLQVIDTRMQALGYTKLNALPAAGTANTVGLHMSVLKGTQATYYPGYWCDYWYWYSCYYNWTYAGSYNYGMAVLEMGDFSTPGGSQPLKVAWLTGIYGVAQGPTLDIPNLVNALNRAFDQSPYLDTH
jgi:hypothetical protein